MGKEAGDYDGVIPCNGGRLITENYGLFNFYYTTIVDKPIVGRAFGPTSYHYAGAGKGGDAIPSL